MEKGGSAQTALRYFWTRLDQAALLKLAVALLELDLSNAFGSLDPNLLFEVLVDVYHIEAGVAAFLAFSTKFRSQTMDRTRYTETRVGAPQGSPI